MPSTATLKTLFLNCIIFADTLVIYCLLHGLFGDVRVGFSYHQHRGLRSGIYAAVYPTVLCQLLLLESVLSDDKHEFDQSLQLKALRFVDFITIALLLIFVIRDCDVGYYQGIGDYLSVSVVTEAIPVLFTFIVFGEVVFIARNIVYTVTATNHSSTRALLALTEPKSLHNASYRLRLDDIFPESTPEIGKTPTKVTVHTEMQTDTITDSIEDLQADNQQLIVIQRDLLFTVARLQDAIDQERKEVLSKDSELDDVKKQLAMKVHEFDHLRSAADALQEQIESAHVTETESKLTIKTQHERLTSAQAMITTLEASLALHQSKLTTDQLTSNDRVLLLETEIQALQQKLHSQTEEIQAIKSENDSYFRNLFEARTENEEFSHRLNQAQAENQTLQANIDELLNSRAALQQQLDENLTECMKLEHALFQHQEGFKNKNNNNNAKHQQTVQRLRNERVLLEESIAKKDQSLQEYEANMATLVKEVQHLTALSAAHEAQLQQQAAISNQELLQTKDELQTHISDLELGLSRKYTEIAALNEYVAEMEDTIAELHTKYELLQEGLELAHMRHAESEQRLRDFNNKVQRLQSADNERVLDLQADLATAQLLVSEWEAEVKQHEETTTSIHTTLIAKGEAQGQEIIAVQLEKESQVVVINELRDTVAVFARKSTTDETVIESLRVEVEQLKENVTALQVSTKNKISDLESALSNKESETARLFAAAIHEKGSLITKLQQTLQDHEIQTTETIADLASKLTQQAAEGDDLRTLSVSQQDKIEAVSSQLQHSTGENERLLAVVASNRAELDQLCTLLAESKHDLEQSQSRIVEKEAIITSLTNAVSAATSARDCIANKHKSTLDTLQGILLPAQATGDESTEAENIPSSQPSLTVDELLIHRAAMLIEHLNDNDVTIMQQNDEITRQAAEISRLMTALQSTQSETKEKISELEAAVDSAQAEKESLQVEKSQVSEELMQLQIFKTEVDALMESSAASILIQKQAFDDLQSTYHKALVAFEAQRCGLAKSNEEARRAADAAQEEIVLLRDVITKSQADKAVLEELLTDKISQLDTAQAVNMSLQQKVDELPVRIFQLQNALHGTQSEARDKVVELETALTTAQGTIASLQEEKSQFTEEIEVDTLLATNQSLLEASNASLTALKHEKADLLVVHEKLVADYMERQRALEEIEVKNTINTTAVEEANISLRKAQETIELKHHKLVADFDTQQRALEEARLALNTSQELATFLQIEKERVLSEKIAVDTLLAEAHESLKQEVVELTTRNTQLESALQSTQSEAREKAVKLEASLAAAEALIASLQQEKQSLDISFADNQQLLEASNLTYMMLKQQLDDIAAERERSIDHNLQVLVELQVALSKKTAVLISTASALESTQQALSRSENEKTALLSALHKLQTKPTEVVTAFEANKLEIDQLLIKNEKLQADLANKEVDLERLLLQILDMETSIVELQQTATGDKTEIDATLTIVDELQLALENSKSSLSECRASLVAVQQQLQIQTEENNKLAAYNEQVTTSLAIANCELSTALDTVTHLQTTHVNAVITHQQIVHDKEQIIVESSEKLHAKLLEIEQLSAQLSQLQLTLTDNQLEAHTKTAELSSSLQESQVTLQERTDNYKQLLSDFDKNVIELTALKVSNEDLSHQVEDLQHTISEQALTIETSQFALEDVNVSLVVAREEIDLLQKESKAKINELLAAYVSLQELLANHNQLKADSDNNITELTKLKLINEDLSQQLRDLQQTLAEQTAVIASNHMVLEEERQKTQSLRIEKEALIVDFSELATLSIQEKDEMQQIIDKQTATIVMQQTQCTDLMSVVAASEANIADQQYRIQALESSLAAANERLQVNETLRTDLVALKNQLQGMNSHLTSTNTTLKQQLSDQIGIINDQNASLDRLQSTVDRLKSELNVKTAEHESLSDSFKQTQQRLDAEEAELAALKVSCQTAVEELAATKTLSLTQGQSLQAKQTDLAEERLHSHELQSTVDELQRLLSEKSSLFDMQHVALQDTNAALNETKASLVVTETKLKQTQQEMKSFTDHTSTTVQLKDVEIVRLTLDTQRLQEALTEAKVKVDELLTALHAAEDEVASKTIDQEKLENVNDLLREELARQVQQSQQQIDTLNSEIGRLQADATSDSNDLQAATSQVRSLDDQLSLTNAALQIAQDNLTASKDVIKIKEAAIQNLEEERAKLAEDVIPLQQALVESQALVASKEAEIESLQVTELKLEAAMAEQQATVADITSEITAMQTLLQSQEQGLTEKMVESVALTTVNSHLMTEVQESKETVFAQRAEIDRLSLLLSSSKNEAAAKIDALEAALAMSKEELQNTMADSHRLSTLLDDITTAKEALSIVMTQEVQAAQDTISRLQVEHETLLNTQQQMTTDMEHQRHDLEAYAILTQQLEQALASTKKDLAKAETKILKHEAMLDVQRTAAEEKDQMIITLTTALEEIKANLSSSQAEQKRLVEEIEESTINSQRLEQALAVAKKEVAASDITVMTLQSTIKRLEDMLHKHKLDFTTAQTTINKLQQERFDLAAKNSTLQIQIDHLSTDYSSVQQDMAKLEVLLQEKNHMIDLQYSSFAQQLQQNQNRLLQENQLLQAQLLARNNELESIHAALQTAQNAEHALKLQVSELESVCTVLKVENHELKVQVSQSTSWGKLTELQNELDAAQNDRHALSTLSSTLQHALTQAKNETAKVYETVEQLQCELKESKEALQDMQSEYEEKVEFLQYENHDLELALHDKTEELSTIQASLQASEQCATQSAQEHEKMQSEITTLRAQLTVKQAQIDELRTSLAASQIEQHRSKQDIANRESKLAAAITEREALRQQLQGQVNREKQEKQCGEVEMEQLYTQLLQTKEELESSQHTTNTLQQQLKDNEHYETVALNAAELHINQLQRACDEQNEVITSLTEQLHTLQALNAQHTAMLASKDEAIEVSKHESSVALEALEAIIARLQQELAAVQQEVEDVQYEKRVIKKEFIFLRDALGKVQDFLNPKTSPSHQADEVENMFLVQAIAEVDIRQRLVEATACAETKSPLSSDQSDASPVTTNHARDASRRQRRHRSHQPDTVISPAVAANEGSSSSSSQRRRRSAYAMLDQLLRALPLLSEQQATPPPPQSLVERLSKIDDFLGHPPQRETESGRPQGHGPPWIKQDIYKDKE